MKPYADFYETYKNKFITGSKIRSRLINSWGTEDYEGVEVLKKEFEVFPNVAADEKRKILNMLGMRKQLLGESFEGLRKFTLWFNPMKEDNAGVTAELIADKIMEKLDVGTWYTVGISYSVSSKTQSFNGYTPAQIETYLVDNYLSLMEDEVLAISSDNFDHEVLGRYVLADTEDHFEVSVSSATASSVKRYEEVKYDEYGHNQVPMIDSALRVTLKYKLKKPIAGNSNLAMTMANESISTYKSKIVRVGRAAYDANHTNDYENTEEVFDMNQYLADNYTSQVYYKGRVRADFVRGAKTDQILALLRVIDTEQYKKKVSFLKRVITGIVFIVAVLLAAYTGGGSLAAFATAMAVATVTVSLIMAGLARNGEAGWAGTFGPVVNVMSNMSKFLGYTAMIESIATKPAEQAATQAATEAVKSAAVDAAVQIVATGEVDVKSAVKSGIQGGGVGATDTITQKIMTTLALIMKVITTRESYKLNKVQRQIKEQQAVVEEQNQELNQQGRELGWEDIKWGNNPLTVDNAIYNTDYQYEPTEFNVQRASFAPTGMNIRT